MAASSSEIPQAASVTEIRSARLQDREAQTSDQKRMLAALEEIDLFVHDSRHSERNLLYELERARAVVRPGGFLIADDVDLNCGLHRYREQHAEDRALEHAHRDRR